MTDAEPKPAAGTVPPTEDIDWLQIHEVHNLRRRAMAGVVDLVVLGFVYVVLSDLIGHTIHKRVVTHGAKHSVIVHSAQLLAGWQLALYITICFAHFIVLEWLFGRTLGKLLFSLRVTNMREEPLSLLQSIVRNLIRALDGLPYILPYAAGLFMAASNENRQRLGDIVAKTIVIDST